MKVPRLFDSQDLRCCKLTDAHLNLTSYSKMRVIYAAQVLSRTVSQLMKARGGDEMIRSAWIAELFDKWFDCMNTTTNYKYNENMKPFFWQNDERLKWLEETFCFS